MVGTSNLGSWNGHWMGNHEKIAMGNHGVPIENPWGCSDVPVTTFRATWPSNCLGPHGFCEPQTPGVPCRASESGMNRCRNWRISWENGTSNGINWDLFCGQYLTDGWNQKHGEQKNCLYPVANLAQFIHGFTAPKTRDASVATCLAAG